METYFDAMTAKPGSAGQLTHDLRTLAEDAEKVLRAGCQTMGRQTRAAAEHADGVIRRSPYGSIGVALGLGFLVGLWIGRK